MSDLFDDKNIINEYTLEQAVEDSVLIQILSWNSKPVVATAAINHDFGLGEMMAIFHEFKNWQEYIEPYLPEQDKHFATTKKNRTVWVIEDGAGITILYPDDY